MAGLPKKYAKMGFKKGWKAYKRSKTTKRKTKKIKVKRTMARRRRTAKRRRSRRSKGILGGVGKPLLGAGGVILYEAFISPKIPLNGTAKNLAELGGGLWLSRKSGMIGATGKTLATISAYQLVKGLAGGMLSSGASAGELTVHS